MKIAVIGSGYVGLVAAACFAAAGHSVVCIDSDAARIDTLSRGRMPIHEPGLPSLVRRGLEAGLLRFRSQYELTDTALVFIAVGTPPGNDGGADIGQVLAAAHGIGRVVAGPLVVVNKCTVPVGTAAKVGRVIADEMAERGVDHAVAIVSNPEFMREGSALADFMRPDRIILGADDPCELAVLRDLYGPFCSRPGTIIAMDVRSAELTKYASNAMLASRISFMNELAGLAEAVDADIELVRIGMGADTRIGGHFLHAGVGYGGSCFPKDVKALVRMGEDHGVPLRIIAEVDRTNEVQRDVMYAKLKRFFGGEGRLRRATIAVWGLAFKPDTDDLRSAPSLALIERLLAAGAQVRAYDPVAGRAAVRVLMTAYGASASHPSFALAASADEALVGADALVLMTEWAEFRTPDLARLGRQLRRRVIFDGRNLYDPAVVARAGLHYIGIGRRTVRGKDNASAHALQAHEEAPACAPVTSPGC